MKTQTMSIESIYWQHKQKMREADEEFGVCNDLLAVDPITTIRKSVSGDAFATVKAQLLKTPEGAAVVRASDETCERLRQSSKSYDTHAKHIHRMNGVYGLEGQAVSNYQLLGEERGSSACKDDPVYVMLSSLEACCNELGVRTVGSLDEARDPTVRAAAQQALDKTYSYFAEIKDLKKSLDDRTMDEATYTGLLEGKHEYVNAVVKDVFGGEGIRWNPQKKDFRNGHWRADLKYSRFTAN